MSFTKITDCIEKESKTKMYSYSYSFPSPRALLLVVFALAAFLELTLTASGFSFTTTVDGVALQRRRTKMFTLDERDADGESFRKKLESHTFESNSRNSSPILARAPRKMSGGSFPGWSASEDRQSSGSLTSTASMGTFDSLGSTVSLDSLDFPSVSSTAGSSMPDSRSGSYLSLASSMPDSRSGSYLELAQ